MMLEKRIIEIASNRYQRIPIDTTPIDWFGYHAINAAILESHLCECSSCVKLSIE
jgi:hypothetical protein